MDYHKRPLYLKLMEAVGKERELLLGLSSLGQRICLFSCSALYVHTYMHTALFCTSCSASPSSALHVRSAIKPPTLLLVKSYQRHWPAAGDTVGFCCSDAPTCQSMSMPLTGEDQCENCSPMVWAVMI